MRTTVRALAIGALLLATLVAAEDATPAEAKSGPSILSGGDLTHSITLAVEDSLALWFPPDTQANIATLTGWPSRLDTPPSSPGTGYSLSSELELWLLGGNTHALWRDAAVGDGRRPGATYYPAVAALEIRIGDDPPRWARLDDGRSRLLNRYIELGRAGALPQQPSILDVLAAEARAGRITSASVNGQPLPPAALEAFWRTVGSSAWAEVPVRASLTGAKAHTGAATDYDEAVEAMVYGFPTPVWLAFDVDGREVELAYYPMTGVLAGIPAPDGNAWVGRGFVIPTELRDPFHASLGRPAPLATAGPTTVEPRVETPVEASPSGRLDGRAGNAAALALLALTGLAVGAIYATLVHQARRPAA